MPSVTIVSDTAAARYAVAPLDSAVNDILERLKEICERAEDISDRLFAACMAALDELELFESYDLADELKYQRNSFVDALLEIEIAAHDLDELVNLITSALCSKTAKGRSCEMAPSSFSEDSSMRKRTSTAFHLDETVRLVAGVNCLYCRRELRAQDVEPLDRGNVRIVCLGCHRDLLTIESR
jgi:hypothetical protein